MNDESSGSNLPQWGNKFNPFEFGSMMPENAFTKQFALSPWRELRRQLFLFLIHVLPPDYNQLSVAEEPSAEIEKRTDDWIRTFVNASKRKGMIPPDDLRKWAAVRARRALILTAEESELDEEYKRPDMRRNFSQEILSRLVDQWHEAGKNEWLLNPGETDCEEVTTITWQLKHTGVKLKPSTTWTEVMKLADTLLERVNFNDRYPVGRTCSELQSDLCDIWFREAILSPDGAEGAEERTGIMSDGDVAPWLAARLQTAKHSMKSYIRQGSSAPSPEGNTEQALYVLVVSEWKKRLSNVWLGFHYQKGKLVWDPLRVPSKGDFSAN